MAPGQTPCKTEKRVIRKVCIAFGSCVSKLRYITLNAGNTITLRRLYLAAEAHYDFSCCIIIRNYYTYTNGLHLDVGNYTGAGTYTTADHDAHMIFRDTDSALYGAGDPGYECEYIKLVITEDDGTIVKGKFYGVVSREVPDVYPDYHVEYRAIKGGHFIARWIN